MLNIPNTHHNFTLISYYNAILNKLINMNKNQLESKIARLATENSALRTEIKHLKKTIKSMNILPQEITLIKRYRTLFKKNI